MKNRLLLLICATMLVCCVIFLSLTPSFYKTAIASPFFCLALLSVVLIHLAVRPWSDAIWVVLGAGLLAILDIGLMRFRPGLVPIASLIGMSSIAVFGAKAILATLELRKVQLCGFIPALLFVVSEWFATSLLAITELLHPKTFDLYLFSFDASLGTELSFVVGRWFVSLPWLRLASLAFYIGLPVAIALAYSGQLRVRGRAALPAAVAFLITGPLGVVFYNTFPAMGPVHVFRMFPRDPLTLAEIARLFLEPIRVAGPRNAIPSLHMAWVLLAWWNSKSLPWWSRAIILAFVMFTVLATMGTGEHYFIDLVVAFPFALFVQALSRFDIPLASRRRAASIFAGLAMVVVWLAWLAYGLRLAWISPIIPWTAIVATVISCCYLIRSVQLPEILPIPSCDRDSVGDEMEACPTGS